MNPLLESLLLWYDEGYRYVARTSRWNDWKPFYDQPSALQHIVEGWPAETSALPHGGGLDEIENFMVELVTGKRSPGPDDKVQLPPGLTVRQVIQIAKLLETEDE